MQACAVQDMALKPILFVCTGNVFRSMSAQYCLKQYLKKRGITDFQVTSAGIEANPQQVSAKTLETLNALGISSIHHRQQKLSKKLLTQNDIVIAMAENHVRFMRDKFGYTSAVLFNELAVGEHTSVLDICDEVKDQSDVKAVEAKINRTVREIHAKTPCLYEQLCNRVFLFADFVDEKRNHRNGYPFIKLLESSNCVAFMSIDIPSKEDGHILVIPKIRHANLEDVPDGVVKEMAVMIKRLGRCLHRTHGGYNVLLNNGRDAGQCIYHTHFHIVPRKQADDIRIEVWKKKQITRQQFVKLNQELILNLQST